MKYPKHALKTEEEFRAAVAAKKPIWMVETNGWGSDTNPHQALNLKFHKTYGKYRVYKPDNKYWITYERTNGDDEYYWLFRGEANIPEHDHGERKDPVRMYIFVFTNFWHAWACHQKLRGKK